MSTEETEYMEHGEKPRGAETLHGAVWRMVIGLILGMALALFAGIFISGCKSSPLPVETKTALEQHAEKAALADVAAEAAEKVGQLDTARLEREKAQRERDAMNDIFEEHERGQVEPWVDFVLDFVPGGNTTGKPIKKAVLPMLLALAFKRSREHLIDSLKNLAHFKLKEAGLSLLKAPGLIHTEPTDKAAVSAPITKAAEAGTLAATVAATAAEVKP